MFIRKVIIFIVIIYLAQIFSAFVTQWLNIFIPQPYLPITVFSTCLNFVEVFFLLITVSMIVIWVQDLRKSSLMHSNLKSVCYRISFHIATVSVLQIVTIIDKYTESRYIPRSLFMLITAVHGCSTMHYTLDPFLVVIERSLATLKVANYEQLTSRKRWIVLIFIQELFGIVAFYVFTSSTVSAILFAIFWILLLIFTVITGIILYRVNLRSYKTRIGTLHLTTRYQTVENIRCLKPVLIYSFLAVIQQIASFALLLIMLIHLINGDTILGSKFESVTNLVVAVFSATYPMSFLAYSSRIRRLLKRKLKLSQKSGVVSPKSTQVLSVMGKVLTSKNEQNIYFTQFNTAWK